jgi:type IV fimbrial biogenesis protein FimT
MRGFSLIELMITLTVVGILLLIAVPNFQTWIANSKARTVAEALQNDLRLAQATAMTQGRRTVLVLTNSSNFPTQPAAVAATNPATNASYWYVQTIPSTLALGNGEVPIPVDSSPVGTTTGVSITTVGLLGGVPVNAVCFNSLGRQTAASGTNVPPDDVPAGANCVVQSTQFNIAPPVGGNRTLAVQVSAGGTVRACDPNFTQLQQPFGC